MRASAGLLTLLLTGLVASPGCGYRPPGMMDPAGRVQRLYAAPFTNRTFRAGLDGMVAAAVLRQLQLNGGVSVVEESQAEHTLKGVVRLYENDAIAFDPTDVGRRFRVRVYLTTTLSDRRGGSPPVQREVVGEAFYTAGNSVSGARAAEEDAVRRAVAELAARLVTYLVDDL